MKLRPFDEIFELAAARKGGRAALERMLGETPSHIPKTIAGFSNDRVLSAMTKSIFANGFAYRIIDAKWPAFEAAFQEFEPHACAFLSDDELDARMRDRNLVRSPRKILAVRPNARFVLDLAAEHGGRAARFFAQWPDADFIELALLVRKRGTLLGGETAMRFLRRLGKPAFVPSPDMLAALVREGVLERPTASNRNLRLVQEALNRWSEQSGRDLTVLSRVLSMSTNAAAIPPRPRRADYFRMM